MRSNVDVLFGVGNGGAVPLRDPRAVESAVCPVFHFGKVLGNESFKAPGILHQDRHCSLSGRSEGGVSPKRAASQAAVR